MPWEQEKAFTRRLAGTVTPDLVREVLTAIQEVAWDYEQAHSREDELQRGVLQAIAEGRCLHPAECARLAVSLSEDAFERYCA